jgi:hydrogenase maturation protease
MPTISPPILLIGIGNEYCSDDGAGLAVCRALKTKGFPGALVIECECDGTVLMEIWKNAKRVILIDAVSSGTRPGAIYRFDVHTEHIPLSFSFQSTHAFGIAEAIGLARVLGQLPPYLIIYAIEGKNFSSGKGLSQEVEKAVQQIVELVMSEVQGAQMLPRVSSPP